MNERIEALAKQAAEYAIEFAVKDQELYIPKLMEKFAELVLKECLTLIDDKIADLDEYAAAGDDEFIARSLGAYQAKEVIMDYFGVEE